MPPGTQTTTTSLASSPAKPAKTQHNDEQVKNARTPSKPTTSGPNKSSVPTSATPTTAVTVKIANGADAATARTAQPKSASQPPPNRAMSPTPNGNNASRPISPPPSSNGRSENKANVVVAKASMLSSNNNNNTNNNNNVNNSNGAAQPNASFGSSSASTAAAVSMVIANQKGAANTATAQDNDSRPRARTVDKTAPQQNQPAEKRPEKPAPLTEKPILTRAFSPPPSGRPPVEKISTDRGRPRSASLKSLPRSTAATSTPLPAKAVNNAAAAAKRSESASASPTANNSSGPSGSSHSNDFLMDIARERATSVPKPAVPIRTNVPPPPAHLVVSPVTTRPLSPPPGNPLPSPIAQPPKTLPPSSTKNVATVLPSPPTNPPSAASPSKATAARSATKPAPLSQKPTTTAQQLKQKQQVQQYLDDQVDMSFLDDMTDELDQMMQGLDSISSPTGKNNSSPAIVRTVSTTSTLVPSSASTLKAPSAQDERPDIIGHFDQEPTPIPKPRTFGKLSDKEPNRIALLPPPPPPPVVHSDDEDEDVKQFEQRLERVGVDVIAVSPDMFKELEEVARMTKTTTPLPDDDIARLLDELDSKVAAATQNQVYSSSPQRKMTASPPPPGQDDRYTLLLESLAQDIDSFETTLQTSRSRTPSTKSFTKPIPVNRVPSNSAFSVASTATDSEGSRRPMLLKLYYENVLLNLEVSDGQEGSEVLRAAVVKSGLAGSQASMFALSLVVNSGEKYPLAEHSDVYEVIMMRGGPGLCRLTLDRVGNNPNDEKTLVQPRPPIEAPIKLPAIAQLSQPKQRIVSICIAVALSDYYTKEEDLHIEAGDLFYVLDRNAAPSMWRIKPISRAGKDVLVPSNVMQVDPDGMRKLQSKYGQKIYVKGDSGGDVARSMQQTRLAALKNLSSSATKSASRFAQGIMSKFSSVTQTPAN